MKKFICLSAIVFTIGTSAIDQSYQAAVGFRLGPTAGLTGKFFMDKSASNQMANKSLMQIMNIKLIWPQLSSGKKDKIFDFFIVLIYYAEQFFLSKYTNNVAT